MRPLPTHVTTRRTAARRASPLAVVLAAAHTAASVGPARAQAPARLADVSAPAKARERIGAALDSIAAGSVGRGTAAGFVVLAVRGRDTLAARAYGLADVGTGRYGDNVVVAAAADSAGRRVLRLTRGSLPPVLLRPAARGPDGWTFTDGVARYTFELPPASAPAGARAASPAVWADRGVALQHWLRVP